MLLDSLPMLIRVPLVLAAVITIIVTGGYLADALADAYLDWRD